MVWKFLFVFITNIPIIIDNYTKNRGNFFEWNEYNFDDIDKLILKRKADDNCLKAKRYNHCIICIQYNENLDMKT
jgi:hypothetical protein